MWCRRRSVYPHGPSFFDQAVSPTGLQNRAQLPQNASSRLWAQDRKLRHCAAGSRNRGEAQAGNASDDRDGTYIPSPKPFVGLSEIAYPFHDRDILVTACGRICMHRKKINISYVLAGQRLGIKEVDDGIWLVSFMNYDLGYIDLEQRTLQPLDNPFGPGLSPMS